MGTMLLLAFVVVGVLVLLVIVVVATGYAGPMLKALFGGPQGQQLQSLPYEKEEWLFSPAERSFLGVLEQVVAGRYRIIGKVRLADIVRVRAGLAPGSRQRAFNRIQSKHLDFLACDPATMDVVFAVELDDSSHRQARRQERDEFLNGVMKAAGIPLYHFAAKRTYAVQEVRATIFETPATSG